MAGRLQAQGTRQKTGGERLWLPSDLCSLPGNVKAGCGNTRGVEEKYQKFYLHFPPGPWEICILYMFSDGCQPISKRGRYLINKLIKTADTQWRYWPQIFFLIMFLVIQVIKLFREHYSCVRACVRVCEQTSKSTTQLRSFRVGWSGLRGWGCSSQEWHFGGDINTGEGSGVLLLNASASFYFNHLGLKQKPSPMSSQAPSQSLRFVTEPLPRTLGALNGKGPILKGRTTERESFLLAWL